MGLEYKGIVWLGIYVEDLAKAIHFYEETLGLTLLGCKEHYAHFDAGAGSLLELFSGGKAHSSPKGPELQSSLSAFLVDDLEQTKAILKDRGVQFTDNEGSFENMRWATLVDPEGNRLEIKEIDSAEQ